MMKNDSKINVNHNDLMVDRTGKILVISGWYNNFVPYPMSESDNQIVKCLVCATMILLMLSFVVSFILTVLDYKSSLKTLIPQVLSDKIIMVNFYLLIAILLYNLCSSPNSYKEIEAYIALTILVINCVVFVFDKPCNKATI